MRNEQHDLHQAALMLRHYKAIAVKGHSLFACSYNFFIHDSSRLPSAGRVTGGPTLDISWANATPCFLLWKHQEPHTDFPPTISEVTHLPFREA